MHGKFAQFLYRHYGYLIFPKGAICAPAGIVISTFELLRISQKILRGREKLVVKESAGLLSL